MKQKITFSIASLAVMLGIAAVALPASVGAVDVFSGACGGGGGQPAGGGKSSSLCGAAKSDDAPDLVKNVVNILLMVLGMIAAIAIIIGGIRYTTSNGDASQTKAAKDTILYAVIGLVVAIMAFAIVNFVVDAFTKK